MSDAQKEVKVGDTVSFFNYGAQKTGVVAKVGNDIVHLTDGRWLHLESVTVVNSKKDVK